jgi:hypothetical protein
MFSCILCGAITTCLSFILQFISSDSFISLLHEFKTTLHEWRMWDSIKIIRDHHISVYGKIFLGLSHSCTSLYKLCKLKSDKLTSHVRNLTSELVKVGKSSLPLSTWLDVCLIPPWTWPLSMGYHSFVNTARRRHWQWRDNLHIVVGTATIKFFWVANFMRIALRYHDRTNPH